MSIQESMIRMEATKTIGNNIEWLKFKSDIIKIMDVVAKEEVMSNVLKYEIKVLKIKNNGLRHSNKKHLNDKAALKKALSIILNDKQQGIDTDG